LHWVPQAWREAASYAARSGDADAALRYIDTGMQLTPDGPSLRLKARLLEQKGDAKGAKELRELAATLNPETSSFIRVYDLLGAKKFDEARAAVEAKLAADPKSWRSWALLGTIYGQQGDAAKAKESFDKAMSLAPGQSERVEVQDSINDLAAEKK
jgi:tetratricopeptide (TPR) repeat protein